MTTPAPTRASTRARRVLSETLAAPWAITPHAFDVVLNGASRRSSRAIPARGAMDACYGASAPAAPYTVHHGVAVLSVVGVLMHYQTWFSRWLDAATYDGLGMAIDAALADDSVASILLDVNSPGGEVDGCGERAAKIFAARGEKRIVAYVGGMGCSAAYWIASAADEIVAAPSAMLGCLGVRATYYDARKLMERIGIDEIEIVSSQTPKKVPDLATDDGRAQVQRTVDDLAAVFLDGVAAYRGVDRAGVAEQFGAGDVLVGAHAVAAGLADRLGTFDDLLDELSAGVSAGQRFAASGRPTFPVGASAMPRRTVAATAAAPTISATYEVDAPVTSTVARTLNVAAGDAGTVTRVIDGAAYEVDFGAAGTGIFAESELAADETPDDEETPADDPATAAARTTRRPVTAADLRRLYPAAAAEIATTAATAERARIVAIQALPVAGAHAALLTAAITDGATAHEAAHRVLMAQGGQRQTRLANLAGDEAALVAEGAPSPLGESDGPSSGTAASEIQLILTAGKRPSATARSN